MMLLFNFAGYPAIRILIMLLLGAYLGSTLEGYFPSISITTLFILFIGFIVFTLIIEFNNKLSTPKWILIIRRLNYLAVLILVGALVSGMYRNSIKKSLHEIAFWNSQKWSDITFCGKIHSVQNAVKGRYTVSIDSLQQSNKVRKAHDFKALITVSDTEMQSTGYMDLRQGDLIFAVATVLPVETNTDNAVDFNVQDWLLKLDVSARWKVQTMYYHAHREKTEQLTIIQKSRRYVRKNLDLFFEKSPDLAALAKAMILADKTSISAQTKKLYQQTGLSHVLAVSGFHVSMLLLPLWWFMPRFWLNNKRKWLYLSISIALMFFYVLLTDSPASVQRATIMAGFLLVGRLWHFNGPPINMLAFAAILMLAINPATIFDVGFQLSYAAVSSIFLVFKPIEQLISHDLKSSLLYKWLLSSLLFTFIIQAAMFPLTAYYFGEHAHLGPLANLVYLPFLTFLLFPLFIFAICIGPFIPSLIQEKMVAAFDFCYSLIERFLQWLCEFPIATEQVSPPATMALLGALCVIISLNYWNYPRIRWRAICIGLVCLNLTTIF